MRQTLKDELWTRLKRKVTPEEFEQIMKTYREEERSITRMETEREKELQKVFMNRNELILNLDYLMMKMTTIITIAITTAITMTSAMSVTMTMTTTMTIIIKDYDDDNNNNNNNVKNNNKENGKLQ